MGKKKLRAGMEEKSKNSCKEQRGFGFVRTKTKRIKEKRNPGSGGDTSIQKGQVSLYQNKKEQKSGLFEV